MLGPTFGGMRSISNTLGPMPSEVGGGISQLRVERELRYAQERVDKLLLVCTALWELLKERTDLTEEDLLEKVVQIDAQDGEVDGEVTRRPRPCVKCGRPMSPSHSRCLYCGAVVAGQGAFEGL